MDGWTTVDKLRDNNPTLKKRICMRRGEEYRIHTKVKLGKVLEQKLIKDLKSSPKRAQQMEEHVTEGSRKKND